jgi:hypothetical protein
LFKQRCWACWLWNRAMGANRCDFSRVSNQWPGGCSISHSDPQTKGPPWKPNPPYTQNPFWSTCPQPELPADPFPFRDVEFQICSVQQRIHCFLSTIHRFSVWIFFFFCCTFLFLFNKHNVGLRYQTKRTRSKARFQSHHLNSSSFRRIWN